MAEALLYRKPQRKDRGFILAKEISVVLTADLLRLRTRLLVQDIKKRYSCGNATAMRAVGIARVRLGRENWERAVTALSMREPQEAMPERPTEASIPALRMHWVIRGGRGARRGVLGGLIRMRR